MGYKGDDSTGFQSPAQDYIEGVVDLAAVLDLRRHGRYPVRVKGQALEARGIRDGDILVADAAAEPRPGVVCVAMVGGDVILATLTAPGRRGCWRHREALIGPYYAGLRLIEDAETIEVRGTFPVLDGNDVLDQYEALIRFSEAYPDDPPEVWETGGRIPRLADLSQTDRALFWGRQFLNPYALEGLPEAGQAQV